MSKSGELLILALLFSIAGNLSDGALVSLALQALSGLYVILFALAFWREK